MCKRNMLNLKSSLLFSPEKENVCPNGEVSLVVDHDDAILSEGEVGVTIPAEHVSVVALLRFFQCVIVRGQLEGADMGPGLAVEEDNPALIGGDHEVAQVACNDKN